jgi:hypothetical protein
MPKDLETVCAEAFARLDVLDRAMYDRGFVTRKPNKPSVPEAIGADKSKKPKGPTPMTVNSPKSPSYL